MLSEDHDITVLKLEELPDCNDARDTWLQFCAANDTPVSESNPVMMTVSSTIYRVLLECVTSFQESLVTTDATAITNGYEDGDDVYYRFGGAAICEMLELHYQQIRSCSNEQKDHLSHILQATNTNDKSNIPEYLKYHDRGLCILLIVVLSLSCNI